MSRYVMDDSTIVETDNAKQHWDEDTRWNGNNHISVATGSQWEHETLYLSRKGHYYIEHVSQWQGSTPSARFVTEEEAAHWLVANGHELPDDLKQYAEAICE